MNYIVPVIVIVVILSQVVASVKNYRRMRVYESIFAEEGSWGISRNAETGQVEAIEGTGNSVFGSIKGSINKYIGSNAGSVIDFSLLKDAVDRHCDMVENDINSLTPVPLYLGLAGTMAGVIVGLYSLINTGSITALLSSGTGSFMSAAVGVNDLLTGVAWAMGASICGIGLTTAASLRFKSCKLRAEERKNSFLAWLQAELLPKVSSDMSDALNNMVRNLNSFNETFARNTTRLGSALNEVNKTYDIQARIIQSVRKMDMMGMANANVKVLKELQDCTGMLEQFNSYLMSIHGYTDAIHKFTEMFEKESGRLHVLEEIKLFFERHKGEIAKETADSDLALQNSFRTFREHAEANSVEFKAMLEQQSLEFKNILEAEKATVEQVNEHIRTQFQAQTQQQAAMFQTELAKVPMLEKRLEAIADIPEQLQMLIERIEDSNMKLSNNIHDSLQNISNKQSMSPEQNNNSEVKVSWLSKNIKWIVGVSAVIIALSNIILIVLSVLVKQ